MVKLQSHVVQAGIPSGEAEAWIETLRADIRRIHELRWKLTNGIAAGNADAYTAAGEERSRSTHSRLDVLRRLDRQEVDVYRTLDPYIAKLQHAVSVRPAHEQDRGARDDLGPQPVDVLADLRRLRQAKLRAIDMARVVAGNAHGSVRGERRAWSAITDALMRGAFIVGLRIWVQTLRRDSSRRRQ